jgi:putative OPT family oligopeptide transporter
MKKVSNQKSQGFTPYVPASTIMPELTVKSVVTGIILLIVFGAANAYLGLKVGMTVSASIPAAVVSMAILKGVLRKGTILENNIVQATASSGEAIAGGIVFSLPALYMIGSPPSLMLISLVALFGGLLGVVGMIIFRRYLIVKMHGQLAYPEGTACAQILIAGEKGGVSAKKVFQGGLLAAAYRLLQGGFKLFPESIEASVPLLPGGVIGANAYPSLIGVGYLIGTKISGVMLAGGLLAWIVIIPIITFFGQQAGTPIFPSSATVVELGAWGIWTDYIQYIGAGALTIGGLFEFFKALPVVSDAVKGALAQFKEKAAKVTDRTDKDISMVFIVITFVVIILLMAVLPQVPVGFLGAILVAAFGFFFVSISSRIVGVVGSSSNPISGMTIATIFISAIIMKAVGMNAQQGMVAAIVVGSVVTVAAASAGDISQDLKTGYIVGSTPKYMQIVEVLGVLVFAGMAGFVLSLLNNAYTIGSPEMPAPATAVIAVLVKGIFTGNLPWALLLIGAGIGLVVELMGIPSLPFAIGLYLPVHLSVPIFVGGIIKYFVEKYRKSGEENGTLYASGMVAGDAVIGVILALLTTAGVAGKLAFGSELLGSFGKWAALIMILGVTYTLYSNSKADKAQG